MKVLVVFLGLLALSLGKDLTMEEYEVGVSVAEAVIDVIEQSCIFTDDKQMLRRLAFLESNDGKADDTFEKNGQKHYGGIWQLEETQFRDLVDRTDLHEKILDKFGIDWSTVTWTDLVKPFYSGLACRMWMDTFPSKGNTLPWGVNAQSDYWVNTYRKGTDRRTEEYTDAINQLDEKCDVPKADIVFVLDGSGSIGAGNFQTMLKFVEDVVEAFDVKADGVRIGVIQYSSNSRTEFSLGEITDKITVKTNVQRINYLKGSTNTASALDRMREMFANDKGHGKGVPQIGVVMTDGKSTDPAATKKAALKVHNKKLTTFAIGVTSGVDMSELVAIGTDPTCVHVHHLLSFSDISPFTSKIQNQACKAPAELLPGEEVEGGVKTGRRVFFKIKIRRNKKGIHFKLKMKSGGSLLFVSYKARNPSQAIYDYGLTVNSAMQNGAFLNIPFPGVDVVKSDVDVVDAYAAIMGDGIGQANDFVMSAIEGLSSGGKAAAPTMFLAFVTVLLGLFVRL